MTDPYTPPGAPVADPARELRGSSFKAVVVGFLVDVIGTMIVSTLLAVVVGTFLADEGADALENSRMFMVLGLAVGGAFTALGGYIAARIANHAEYKHALVLGIVSLVFGELMMLFVPDYDFGLRIAGDLLMIPAALFGGWLRVQQKLGEPAPA